jgi:hypothetical protein
LGHLGAARRPQLAAVRSFALRSSCFTTANPDSSYWRGRGGLKFDTGDLMYTFAISKMDFDFFIGFASEARLIRRTFSSSPLRYHGVGCFSKALMYSHSVVSLVCFSSSTYALI